MRILTTVFLWAALVPNTFAWSVSDADDDSACDFGMSAYYWMEKNLTHGAASTELRVNTALKHVVDRCKTGQILIMGDWYGTYGADAVFSRLTRDLCDIGDIKQERVPHNDASIAKANVRYSCRISKLDRVKASLSERLAKVAGPVSFDIKGFTLALSEAEFLEKFPSGKCEDESLGSNGGQGERLCRVSRGMPGLLGSLVGADRSIPSEFRSYAGKEAVGYEARYAKGRAQKVTVIVYKEGDAYLAVLRALTEKYGEPVARKNEGSVWRAVDGTMLQVSNATSVRVSLFYVEREQTEVTPTKPQSAAARDL